MKKPLFAFYSRALTGTLLSSLSGENLRTCSFIDGIHTEFIEWDDITVRDPFGLSFFNINYAEDIAMFESIRKFRARAAKLKESKHEEIDEQCRRW